MKDLSNSVRKALSAGETTVSRLTKAFLDRIESLDRHGPSLNSVRVINPDAMAIAIKLDASRRKTPRPLEGIPILLKDNIATGDKQPTTAGSLALADAKARRDATVTKLLREAGAVILGKANLTEFANFLAVGMPSGYSSLGGQVRNAWAPDIFKDSIPVVQPGGSSAGSGVAVAAGLAVATIGSETSGSLLSPANQSGIVTVKPTVGLISRAGILPISEPV
jgi:amidase